MAYIGSLELGERYSLHPWGKDTMYYKGMDDGGKEYLLPDGYHVGKLVDGSLVIYDNQKYYTKLVDNKGPAIVSQSGDIINLKLV